MAILIVNLHVGSVYCGVDRVVRFNFLAFKFPADTVSVHDHDCGGLNVFFADLSSRLKYISIWLDG